MSKLRDSVRTPQHIIESLEKEFGPLFDPCPFNPAFDPKIHPDGLEISWADVTFVNPPYSNVKPWIINAHKESRTLDKTVILLIKTQHVCTEYFRRYGVGTELRFFSHRLKFASFSNVAHFSSVLVFFLGKQWISQRSWSTKIVAPRQWDTEKINNATIHVSLNINQTTLRRVWKF